MKSRIIEPRALYLCDQKAGCNDSPICGKECKRTKNVNHALNGPVVNCREWEERFKLIEIDGLLWWEENE